MGHNEKRDPSFFEQGNYTTYRPKLGLVSQDEVPSSGRLFGDSKEIVHNHVLSSEENSIIEKVNSLHDISKSISYRSLDVTPMTLFVSSRYSSLLPNTSSNIEKKAFLNDALSKFEKKTVGSGTKTISDLFSSDKNSTAEIVKNLCQEISSHMKRYTDINQDITPRLIKSKLKEWENGGCIAWEFVELFLQAFSNVKKQVVIVVMVEESMSIKTCIPSLAPIEGKVFFGYDGLFYATVDIGASLPTNTKENQTKPQEDLESSGSFSKCRCGFRSKGKDAKETGSLESCKVRKCSCFKNGKPCHGCPCVSCAHPGGYKVLPFEENKRRRKRKFSLPASHSGKIPKRTGKETLEFDNISSKVRTWSFLQLLLLSDLHISNGRLCTKAALTELVQTFNRLTHDVRINGSKKSRIQIMNQITKFQSPV